MKRMMINSGLALALALSAVGLAAAASEDLAQDSGQVPATLNAVPSSRIQTQFSNFAGSTDNAQSLIQGLRTGSTITLTGANNSTVSFAVPTSTLGYGEVAISLGLAQQSLANYGITDPTPEQIQAALVGGTVTTADGGQAQLAGVLALRESGMGWGRIAQTYGVKLGSIVSAIESGSGHVRSEQARGNEPEQGEQHEASESGQIHGQSASDVEANTDAGKLHIDKPDVAEGNHSKPDINKPDISRPEIEKSEIERPDIQRPHIEKPDIERPNIERPNH